MTDDEMSELALIKARLDFHASMIGKAFDTIAQSNTMFMSALAGEGVAAEINRRAEEVAAEVKRLLDEARKGSLN